MSPSSVKRETEAESSKGQTLHLGLISGGIPNPHFIFSIPFRKANYPNFSLTVFCRYSRVSLTPRCTKWPVDSRRGLASLVGEPHPSSVHQKSSSLQSCVPGPLFPRRPHCQLSLPLQSSFLILFVPSLSLGISPKPCPV